MALNNGFNIQNWKEIQEDGDKVNSINIHISNDDTSPLNSKIGVTLELT
jgi:hypothetical protein